MLSTRFCSPDKYEQFPCPGGVVVSLKTPSAWSRSDQERSCCKEKRRAVRDPQCGAVSRPRFDSFQPTSRRLGRHPVLFQNSVTRRGNGPCIRLPILTLVPKVISPLCVFELGYSLTIMSIIEARCKSDGYGVPGPTGSNNRPDHCG
jgi:hypothetical protein